MSKIAEKLVCHQLVDFLRTGHSETFFRTKNFSEFQDILKDDVI